MNQKSQQSSRLLIGGLIVIGVALLIAWTFSVTAYGYEVDELGLDAGVRAQDVLLFAGGVVSILAAIAVFVIKRRRARHSTL